MPDLTGGDLIMPLTLGATFGTLHTTAIVGGPFIFYRHG
jgi:hypothetical protein